MKVTDVIGKLNPQGIQQMIDEQLARVPAAATYIEFVKYVPPGSSLPEGTTHTIEVVSVSGQKVQIALKGKAPYAMILDLLLTVF